MTSEHDAVVIGAGPNGLVAANLLVDRGWSVLVLEAQPEAGGAVRSDSAVHPDFVHDTFSSFYPLAAVSPAIGSLDLTEHGLEWTRAPAVLGHPLPDGDWALLDRDRELTARWFDEARPGDGEAWLRCCAAWDRVSPELTGALLTPFPPLRHGLGTASRLPGGGGLDLLRALLSPVVATPDHLGLRGRLPRTLLAGNAGHADIPLDAFGSGLFGVLLTMMAQTVGFPVPRGGAGELTRALVSRLRTRGGELATGEPAVAIGLRNGRAGVVRTPDREVSARRAVLADVGAQQLYGALLAPADVPVRVRRRMASFRLDPGTVKVDWALSGPVPWSSPPATQPGTVHLADSVDAILAAASQADAGQVPARPFLLAGQMTTTDPTRSPAGTESLWAYTHVPQHTRDDAGDGSVRGAWDGDDCERMADRMQAEVERHAPDLASRIIARRVLGPHDLEARDANLVGGAINGGTARLQQQALLRPVPGTGRAGTGVPGLYLASASAHPGGGVHGACGSNAARAALTHDGCRSFTAGRRRAPGSGPDS